MSMELVEVVPVEDDYCSGLARIEDLGSCARFVLFTNQTMYEAGNRTVCTVRRKIVLPFDAIWPGIEMATAFATVRAISRIRTNVIRLR